MGALRAGPPPPPCSAGFTPHHQQAEGGGGAEAGPHTCHPGRSCATGPRPRTPERALKPDCLRRLKRRPKRRGPDGLCLVSSAPDGGSTLRLGPETDVALPPLIASRAHAPDFSLRRNYIPARGRCQRPAEWRPRGGWGLDGSRPPRTCASRDRWQVLRRSFSSPRHRGPQGLLSAEMPLFYKAFSTRFSSSCFS